MRLLCISSHADTLNSVRPEAELFIGLQRAGVTTTVMTQADSPYAETMAAQGIRIVDFVPQRKFSWAAIKRIRSEIRNHNIQAVYAFNSKAICNAAFACIGLPVVYMTYRGQTGNIYRHDPAAYLTHLHPRVDAIVGVSQSVADDLRPRVRKQVLVQRIYKGHDLSWYTEPASERSELGLNDDHFVVGCVANNRPRKGVKYLIEACAQLRDIQHLRLVLIGNGMDQDTLGATLEQYGIADRTVTLGLRNDATRLIQACDVAVLPAIRREGLPKTVIEAMAYGIPSVVTDTGGNAELVDTDHTGIVVPIEDAPAIAGALRRLCEEPSLAVTMGEAARERIREHFNVAETVDQTKALLIELSAHKGINDT